MSAERIKIGLFYAVSVIFLALNFYLVIAKDSLWLSVLPFALAFVLLGLSRLDYLLLLIVFFTPLSVALKELIPGLSFDMNLPTEPLVFGVLLIFMLKFSQQPKLDRKFVRHPISLAIGFYLLWMLLTCLTSSMAIVSLKFWISKVWFIVAFYILGYSLLQKANNFHRFVLLYAVGFVPVIAYAWWRQSGYGFFDNHAANFVMNPFFKDHTSYGAMLVFFMPALIAVGMQKQLKRSLRILATVLLLIFAVALVFSYTRAAWLSLIVALAVFLLLMLKVKFRTVLLTGGLLLATLFVFQSQLVMLLEKNKQQSSSQLSGHLNSISNVSTDASNVERLNRWSSAIAMFKERPVVGWGPGTYMFQYAPFQKTDLRTIISTNSADGGNAHSEYLGPLAESGFPGLVSILWLVIALLRTGFRVYEKSENKEQRILALSVLMALVSYFTHGFLNNFLDTDKAAIPVWFFAAVLVALDLSQKPAQQEASLNE
ncbi:O-antigen ligase family protein [Mangrovibacterium lignilyticum]|uniref:O-antigen ligase family protein n=1 Tax=Mangrovibacterium lignilyticum TaxID=2668052 RepID=UPI0013D56397|nr:O-antigen ligase family protein [Mangrovibacterium lignilyticum]